MGRKKTRLLLIEDDQIDQMAFNKFAKKENLPYDYSLVDSIQEGIAILQSKRFDVVVTDYMLGDGNAFELFEHMHGTPIIIVTGTGDEEIAVKAMTSGASDYLIKDSAGNYLKTLPVTVDHAIKRRHEELELIQYRHHLEELVQERTAKLRQEIEKRQEIENILRVKENAIESSSTAIGIATLDGRVEYVNPSYAKLYGYESRDEIIGMLIEDFAHPREHAQQAIQQVKESGYFWAEGLGKRKDGSLFHMQIGVNLVQDAAGMPIRILATFIDISERLQAEAALRQSEDKYRSIFENIQDVYYEVTFDGTILELSPSIELLSHYSRKELLGKSLTEIYDNPKEREMFLATIQKNGQVNDYEITLRDKNGVSVPCSISAKLHTDAAGKPAKIIGIMHDISERKKTEARLQLLSSAVEQSSEGIAVIDLDGNLQFTNQAFAKIHSYTQEELLGKHLTICHTTEQLPAVENANRLVEETGWFSGEIWHVKRDGTVFPSMMHNTLLRDSVGKPIGIIGLMRDITKAKQAEMALRESERRLSTLMSNLPGMAYRCRNDRMWTMEFVSEGCLELTGYQTVDLVQNKKISYADLIHPDDIDSVWQSVQTALAEHTSFKLTYRIRTASGAEKWVWGQGRGVFSETDDLLALEGLIIDITDRKQLEGQLVQAQKMEAVGRLAGGVAHDFNNLLTAISGYTQLILTELKEGDPMFADLLEVKKAATRAASLTHQLLAFSRRQILQPQILNVNSIIAEMDNMLQRLIGEDIELIIIPGENLAPIKADYGQIEQVIMNLVINARDAMPNGGKLMIETANVELSEDYSRTHLAIKPGLYIMLAVSDTGIGMSEEIQSHLFEPFFTTKEIGKGTGLGLATVYGIVKQSEGNIWVYSEPGQGTTFKIYLPQVLEKVVIEERGQAAVTEFGGSETILLVEDEDVVRDLAHRVLEKYGYTVLEASQGEDALRICQQFQGEIHLLITDVIMPKISGPELAKQLRPIRPQMKLLYVSGYTDSSIVHHGVMDEGVPFLQKPFTPQVLLRKVRQVLEQPLKSNPNEVKQGK